MCIRDRSYHMLNSGIAIPAPSYPPLVSWQYVYGYRAYELSPRSRGTLSVYLVQVVTSMVISGCKAETLLNRGS